MGEKRFARPAADQASGAGAAAEFLQDFILLARDFLLR
jgi:hypothetical protein